MGTGGGTSTGGGMSTACIKAWTEDGNVPFKYGIPFGAIRKAGIHYGGVLKAILKLTLGGITYNIGKQGKEGLVVVANNYSGVSFFLPDDKSVMTEEDGNTMSIYDYLVMLADTDYGKIGAWDHFALFINQTMSSLMGDVDPEMQEQIRNIPYVLLPYGASSVDSDQLTGAADFSEVATFSDFIRAIYANLDSTSVVRAKDFPLSATMLENGSVGCRFEIKVDIPSEDGESTTTETMGYQLYIGVK